MTFPDISPLIPESFIPFPSFLIHLYIGLFLPLPCFFVYQFFPVAFLAFLCSIDCLSTTHTLLFPWPSVLLLCFFVTRSYMCVTLKCSRTGLRYLLPPFLFGCSLPFFVLDFKYRHFFLFFKLNRLSFVPVLFSTIQSGVSQLCTWYYYHAIA